MTHIDIARNIRYKLLAELHRAAAELYTKQEHGSDYEIRAVVEGFAATLDSLYVHYVSPKDHESIKDESGPVIHFTTDGV